MELSPRGLISLSLVPWGECDEDDDDCELIICRGSGHDLVSIGLVFDEVIRL